MSPNEKALMFARKLKRRVTSWIPRSRDETDRSQVPSSGWVEVERLGLHWRLEMRSCISQSLVGSGVWEPVTTHLIKDLVNPGMHVLDVGANFGYYTLLLAQQVGPTGRVWAFEPVSMFRNQLLWHLERNRFSDRVTVVPYGLSDRCSTSPISVSASSATLHAVDTASRPESIELRPLDEVVPELGIDRIDFVKSDIDGHEPWFLDGGRSTFRRFRPPIAVEFAQHVLHVAGSDVREQARLLHELGYVICSEATREPYSSEMDFLMECGNFTFSGNAIAFPSANDLSVQWSGDHRAHGARHKSQVSPDF